MPRRTSPGFRPESPTRRHAAALRAGLSARPLDTQTPLHNSLENLPVLICADGTSVFESRYIYEWIEYKHPTQPLFPKDIDGILAVKRYAAMLLYQHKPILNCIIGNGYVVSSINNALYLKA